MNLKTFIAIIVTALVVGTGTYYYQAAKYTKDLQPSEAVDSFGIPEGQEEAVKAAHEEKMREVACDQYAGDHDLFTDENTSLTFCYPNDWGTPRFEKGSGSPGTYNGDIFYISFSEPNTPVVSYQSPNYERLGDGDVPPDINWEEIDFFDSNEELSALFNEYENARAEAVIIGALESIRVYRDFDDPLSGDALSLYTIYIPGVTVASEKYNLKVSGPQEQASEIGIVVSSLSINIKDPDAPCYKQYQKYDVSFQYPCEWSTDVHGESSWSAVGSVVAPDGKASFSYPAPDFGLHGYELAEESTTRIYGKDYPTQEYKSEDGKSTLVLIDLGKDYNEAGYSIMISYEDESHVEELQRIIKSFREVRI